jgi:hypothetical protein
MPIEPESHHRERARNRPVQVKVHGARSAPAWIAANQPTFTQSNRFPFQVKLTRGLLGSTTIPRDEASRRAHGRLSE